MGQRPNESPETISKGKIKSVPVTRSGRSDKAAHCERRTLLAHWRVGTAFSEFLVPRCNAHRDCGRDVVPFWHARKEPKSAQRGLKRAIAGISAPSGLPQPTQLRCASWGRQAQAEPAVAPLTPSACAISVAGWCCYFNQLSCWNRFVAIQYCSKNVDCEGVSGATAKPPTRLRRGAPLHRDRKSVV